MGMRKSLYIITAAVLVAVLGACDPDDQGSHAKEVGSIDPAEYIDTTTDTTAGDVDGPAVDRADDGAQLNDDERARLDSWDGSGDPPFGDGANDGRFRDVSCDTSTGRVANGYSGGLACSYADGTHAAQGIDYRNGQWHWADTPISTVGQCPDDEWTCDVVWSHALTMPIIIP